MRFDMFVSRLLVTVFLLLGLTVALQAVGVVDVATGLRSFSHSTDTWLVQTAGEPAPTPQDAQKHAFYWCGGRGVEGVARAFYTREAAFDAAKEYAEEGYSEGPYFDAAFKGCLAGFAKFSA
jgi:hypothetical protein